MPEDRTRKASPFDLCAFCPDLCLDRCPVVSATGSVTYSPFSKMLHGWLLANGRLSPSQETAELAYQCTGCLGCYEACAHKVDVETALFDLRAQNVKSGIVPYDQTLFEVPDEDLSVLQSKVVPKRHFVPEAQAVLFPGCHALRDRPRVVKDTLKVFKALNIEFVGASVDAARCCGYPLYAGGFIRAFRENAERVSAALRPYRMVVVLSDCCVHTMRNLFAVAGVANPPRVTSALELIAPLVTRLEREPLGLPLGYHDSCFTGRHLGQYDLPREVITHVNGMPPIECRRNREESLCCGAGGGWDRTSPVQSKMVAAEVTEMAADAGADHLVSACTTCSNHLEESGGDFVEVEDIFSLVARWLNPPRRRRR